MSTYMVIEAEISDTEPLREQFKKYAAAAAKSVLEFGGEYIVRGAPPLSLEGDWPPETKLVISKWASERQALAFWNSPEYAKIRKLRLDTAKVRVTLFEGVDGK